MPEAFQTTVKLHGEPAKERVENPGSIIVNGSGAITAGAGAACRGNFFDLVS